LKYRPSLAGKKGIFKNSKNKAGIKDRLFSFMVHEMIEKLTSKENKTIRTVHQLKHRKYREQLGLFLAEGPNLIDEALKCMANIRFVVYNEEDTAEDHGRKSTTEIQTLLTRLQEAGVPLYEVDRKLFCGLSDTEAPQGILAVIGKKAIDTTVFFGLSADEDHRHGNFLVLDRVQDPGNLGTMLRTADAAGYQGVILMKGCGDIFAPKVVRATAGSIFRLPALYIDEPEQAIVLLKQQHKKMICTMPKGPDNYFDIPMDRDCAVIIGNEGSGICEAFAKAADHQVRIPMAGSVDSLNASVAAGILLYESVRQQSK
jgi:TrmH family RNA methyltransferase